MEAFDTFTTTRGWQEQASARDPEPELINEVAGSYVRVRFLTPLEKEAGSSR